MQYLFLVLIVLCYFSQQYFQKLFNNKNGKKKSSPFFYSFIFIAAALIGFAIYFLFDRQVNVDSIPYGLAFGASYIFAVLFQILAIKTGPLSITALVVSFSLTIPTFYGLIFLNENLSTLGIIGLCLLAVSLILINDYSKSESKPKPIYYLYLFLAFIGNGCCSLVQKMHIIKFSGNYSPFLLLVGAGFFFFIMCMLFPFFKKPEFKIFSKDSISPSICGLINVLTNVLIIACANILPASIQYPVTSGGGIVLTFIVSMLVLKERFKPYQYIGYAFGLISVILISI